jgi:hypothetical protein
MKHISVVLLQITEQQLFISAQVSGLYATLDKLSESHSIDALATVPLLDAELYKLADFNKRINQRIQRAIS